VTILEPCERGFEGQRPISEAFARTKAEARCKMIRLPLSQTGQPAQFAQSVQAHIEALTAHMMGPPGKAAPRASDLIENVIARVPQDGPVATRGPDRFIALPYEVFDDTPKTPEQQKAIDTLRSTIIGA
jgi:hypothetical protein